MTTRKPSTLATQNVLHFNSLEPRAFERLCLALRKDETADRPLFLTEAVPGAGAGGSG